MTALGPAGLDAHDLAPLSERRLRRLAAWHARVAGDDDGRPFWPLAVRRLAVAERLDYAEEPEAMAYWTRGEQLRVEAEPAYFTEAYGHVQPERQGAPPIPFELWEMVEAAAERAIGAACQREVLELFVSERIVVVLKARQLGLTWLALHFALWLMGYCRDLPRANVLALSKVERDAQKLLRRLRRIDRLLPPYLRRGEDPDTRGSLSRFKLAGRGEAQSLVSSPDAARTEQADLFLWDEAAFTRNGGFADTWTAALPTLGPHGSAVVISTGNGPADAPGDGQGFAELFERAAGVRESAEGEVGMAGVFLPDDVAPGRGDEWREAERRVFVGETWRFDQEHPRIADEALAGGQGVKVYPLAGIAAAAELGAELDARLRDGTLPPPAGHLDGAVAGGTDYGAYYGSLIVWELEGGGVYVPPSEHLSHGLEVSEKVAAWLERVRRDVQEPYATATGRGGLVPQIAVLRYDAAGLESHKTAVKTVEARPDLRAQFALSRTGARERPWKVRSGSVNFGELGQARRGARGTFKALTMGYLAWLFARTASGERVGVIAVSPENPELLRQLRGLEWKDDRSGRVEKGDDEGPDALVAGTARIALDNIARMPEAAEDDRRAA